MSDWLFQLVQRLDRGESVVRVVVSAVRGSAPREPGACMLVTASQAHGTIGGGHLEWKALEIARHMLEAATEDSPRVDRFTLGATLGQCCGGAVELWFERVTPDEREFFREALGQRRSGAPLAMTSPQRSLVAAQPGDPRARVERAGGEVLIERIDTDHVPLILFGAGHVGQALVRVLVELPFDITWVDEREDLFADVQRENVTTLISEMPADEVAAAPSQAMYLVLTHRHDLDFDLCRAILARDDVRWVGMIGSASKAASFRKRLARQGAHAERLARLVSPIGVAGIDSKEPAAIAVAVAAQLLQAIAATASLSLPRTAAR